MADVTGLNIRECMNRIVEGSTVTVGTGKNAEAEFYQRKA